MNNSNYSTNSKELALTTVTGVRLIVERLILDQLTTLNKDFRAQVEKTLEPGDSRKIRTTKGVEVGTIGRSSVTYKAVPEDMAVVLADAADRGIELIDTLPPEDDPRYQTIIAILFEHAPELLDTSIPPESREELADEVLEEWEITDHVREGWKIVKTAPRFSVRPKRSQRALLALEAEMNTSGVFAEEQIKAIESIRSAKNA